VEIPCKEVEIPLEMMFRDPSELRQPLAKEAVGVLAGVRVSVTDDVSVEVGDSQVAVLSLSSSSIPS